MTIGERIKKKRLDMHLTLEELSKLVDVQRQTLSRYETGIISNIPLTKIEQLAKIFNCSPSYLLGWSDNEEQSDIKTNITIIGQGNGGNKSIVVSKEDFEVIKTVLDAMHKRNDNK